jgi:hypothetical protein
METPANDTIPQPQPQIMNRKLRYYYNHKNDPVFIERTAQAKARYYQRNREDLKAKALARYYEMKAILGAEVLNPI